MSPLSLSLRFLQTQSDAQLAKLAGEGHERAFEALVRRYRKPLLAYCRRMATVDVSAEDILQQALLQAWTAIRTGVEIHDPRAWLYRIVHNVAVSDKRRSRAIPVPLRNAVSANGADQAAEQRMAAREALQGLAALPEMQREVMLGTAVDGMSHEEVADALGLSSGAVRGLIYRARATLRAAAAALLPGPVIGWAVRGAERTRSPGLCEALAGGGSAGLGGVIMKGGAIAVTAGALATAGINTNGEVHRRHAARIAAAAVPASPMRHATPREPHPARAFVSDSSTIAAHDAPVRREAPAGGTVGAQTAQVDRRRRGGKGMDTKLFAVSGTHASPGRHELDGGHGQTWGQGRQGQPWGQGGHGETGQGRHGETGQAGHGETGQGGHGETGQGGHGETGGQGRHGETGQAGHGETGGQGGHGQTGQAGHGETGGQGGHGETGQGGHGETGQGGHGETGQGGHGETGGQGGDSGSGERRSGGSAGAGDPGPSSPQHDPGPVGSSAGAQDPSGPGSSPGGSGDQGSPQALSATPLTTSSDGGRHHGGGSGQSAEDPRSGTP